VWACAAGLASQNHRQGAHGYDDRTFINDVLSEDEASEDEASVVEPAEMVARAPRRTRRTRKRARCEECGEPASSCDCEDDLSLLFD
jgi:hypothetical protein